MTKPGKIYKDPDSWVMNWAFGIIITGVILSLGFLGLIIWDVVEFIQLLGRLG